jgi:hypothetical protein
MQTRTMYNMIHVTNRSRYSWIHNGLLIRGKERVPEPVLYFQHVPTLKGAEVFAEPRAERGSALLLPLSARHRISMAPRGVFAAKRRPPLKWKCKAGRARGGARARTFWSSGGLVMGDARSPARSVPAHPGRRARTPNGLFGRPRPKAWPKVGAAGGMARERRRVAPTHDRTSAAAPARACVRPRLLRERPQPGCV